MKQFIKTAGETAKHGSIKVASKILGATDFLGQTISDVSQDLEATIKLKAYGVDPLETKYARVHRTIEHQQAFIDKYVASKTFVQNLRKGKLSSTAQSVTVVEPQMVTTLMINPK